MEQNEPKKFSRLLLQWKKSTIDIGRSEKGLAAQSLNVCNLN